MVLSHLVWLHSRGPLGDGGWRGGEGGTRGEVGSLGPRLSSSFSVLEVSFFLYCK